MTTCNDRYFTQHRFNFLLIFVLKLFLRQKSHDKYSCRAFLYYFNCNKTRSLLIIRNEKKKIAKTDNIEF